MIEVKNLSCSFSEGAFTKNKFTAVSPISAIFKNGGRYAIVGESGSGKTTLARMIAGLQRPDNGNVLIDGIAVYGRRRIAERIYAHFFLGMSNADIARLEGCDITSVRDGIKRGLRQLEKYFEKNLL